MKREACLVRGVAKNGLLELSLPEYAGQTVEIIIRAQDKSQSADSSAALTPEQHGFMQQVLASPEEDVWNDL